MTINPAYLERIRQSCPDLLLHQVEINREGLVNDVVIVNRQRVFRFPKNDWAVEMLHREAKVLDLAHRYVDLRLPVFDIRQSDMVSYAYLAGDALLRDDIMRWDERTQEALAETLATFLHQLHTIPRDVLESEQIPPSDAVRTAADWLQLYEDVQREVFPLLMSDAKEWVRRLFQPLVDDPGFVTYEPTLINGDIGPYHVLCDRSTHQITGIIDFGTAGLGDPAGDFACILNAYGETFVRRMARKYPIPEAYIDRARFYAGTLELQWVLGGLRSNDDSWFTVHIGRARDVMPIGMGW